VNPSNNARQLNGGGPACPVRAVTFDVGGTLIECWPSVGHIYSEVAARHGHPVLSPAVLNRNFKAALKKFKSFRYTPAHWSALVDATFHGLIEPLPSQSFFPELYDRFSDPDAWHVFADVLPALSALKSRGLKLAVVSNWDDRLRPLLNRLNLGSHFQAMVISCEVGALKPDRAMFGCACQALGITRAETLHVGDSLEMDVRGAQAAGLQARWLRRGIRRSSSRAIRSLRQLDKL
jgi:putative hydrolase of the HAD superfamily